MCPRHSSWERSLSFALGDRRLADGVCRTPADSLAQGVEMLGKTSQPLGAWNGWWVAKPWQMCQQRSDGNRTSLACGWKPPNSGFGLLKHGDYAHYPKVCVRTWPGISWSQGLQTGIFFLYDQLVPRPSGTCKLGLKNGQFFRFSTLELDFLGQTTWAELNGSPRSSPFIPRYTESIAVPSRSSGLPAGNAALGALRKDSGWAGV